MTDRKHRKRVAWQALHMRRFFVDVHEQVRP